MGYQMEMPVGMLFRRMYCRYCGEKLVRHKITNVYSAGDPNFDRVMKGGIVNIKQQTKVTYVYKCPSCNKISKCNEQCGYSKIQKRLGRKILSDEDLKK